MLQSQRLVESQRDFFRCKLKDARILLCLLQTINLKEDLIVMFTEKGIQFTSEKNKVFQITAYLQRELFSDFKLPDESIGLKLNIKLFIDCLTSVLTCSGSSDGQDDKDSVANAKNISDDAQQATSIEIFYGGYGEPIHLVLRDEISITECSLSPKDSENIISFDMKPENILTKIIIESDYLRKALERLNFSNVDDLQISVDPEFGLVLTTVGDGVTSTHKIEKSSDKLLNHEFKKLHINVYKSKFIKHCLNALSQSGKTCLKIDIHGLLNIEYMVNTIGEHRCYVQTFCLPNVDTTI